MSDDNPSPSKETEPQQNCINERFPNEVKRNDKLSMPEA